MFVFFCNRWLVAVAVVDRTGSYRFLADGREWMIPFGKRLQKTMVNHHFSRVNQLYIAIFNSYVKLPEGIVDGR